MEGRRKSEVVNGWTEVEEEEMSILRKMSKRRLSLLQIMKKIGDSVSKRQGVEEPSSTFYVPNEDGDEDGIASGLFRTDSLSSLKVGGNHHHHHAYENIGTSSGSEFGGNNETLEENTRQKSSSRGGRNKFAFGSVGNLGESCEVGDHQGCASLTGHAPVGTAAKAKSTRRQRCSASDQNLNGGFQDNDEYEQDDDQLDGAIGGAGKQRIMGRGNEAENENEFGAQSLFIGSRKGNKLARGNSRKDQGMGASGNHVDRRVIGGGGFISGQEINGGAGAGGGSGGWQLDGNCVVNCSTYATAADALDGTANNRASYASSTSRTSTTSTESFRELFARNLKRPFKSNQANKTKVIRNENFF